MPHLDRKVMAVFFFQQSVKCFEAQVQQKDLDARERVLLALLKDELSADKICLYPSLALHVAMHYLAYQKYVRKPCNIHATDRGSNTSTMVDTYIKRFAEDDIDETMFSKSIKNDLWDIIQGDPNINFINGIIGLSNRTAFNRNQTMLLLNELTNKEFEKHCNETKLPDRNKMSELNEDVIEYLEADAPFPQISKILPKEPRSTEHKIKLTIKIEPDGNEGNNYIKEQTYESITVAVDNIVGFAIEFMQEVKCKYAETLDVDPISESAYEGDSGKDDPKDEKKAKHAEIVARQTDEEDIDSGNLPPKESCPEDIASKQPSRKRSLTRAAETKRKVRLREAIFNEAHEDARRILENFNERVHSKNSIYVQSEMSREDFNTTIQCLRSGETLPPAKPAKQPPDLIARCEAQAAENRYLHVTRWIRPWLTELVKGSVELVYLKEKRGPKLNNYRAAKVILWNIARFNVEYFDLDWERRCSYVLIMLSGIYPMHSKDSCSNIKSCRINILDSIKKNCCSTGFKDVFFGY